MKGCVAYVLFNALVFLLAFVRHHSFYI
uniref:Uncharacterized protein n=1 Tax=Arundo donax TaxID=35708 RepID=A0A0A8YY76_ARUDO